MLCATRTFSVVCFRLDASDEENAALLERVNATGEIFISHTRLDGRYVLRFRAVQQKFLDEPATGIVQAVTAERRSALADGIPGGASGERRLATPKTANRLTMFDRASGVVRPSSGCCRHARAILNLTSVFDP